MQLHHVATGAGVDERTFDAGGVSGVLWSPAPPLGPAPLVLVGPLSPGGPRPASWPPGRGALDAQPESFAATYGVHAAWVHATCDEFAVHEWRWALDALLELPSIDADAPVGVVLSAEIGLRLAVSDPRIGVAVITGDSASEPLLALARGIRIPVRVRLPWDDPADAAWFIAQHLLAPAVRR